MSASIRWPRQGRGASQPLQGSALADPAAQAQMQNLAQTQPGAMYVAKNALNGGELCPCLPGVLTSRAT